MCGLVETEILEVALEAAAVVPTEEAGEMPRTGEGHGRGHLVEAQRAVQRKTEMSDRSLQRIGQLGLGRLPLRREAKPDRLEMTAGGVLGSNRISQGEGFNETFVLVGEKAGVGKALLEGPLVELRLLLPDALPALEEPGHGGQADHLRMQAMIRGAECLVIPLSCSLVELPQQRSQAIDFSGRLVDAEGGFAGGEGFEFGAQGGETAEFGFGHGWIGTGRSMRKRTSRYAMKSNSSPSRIQQLRALSSIHYFSACDPLFEIELMNLPEKIPFGVIAPMTTPFSEKGELEPSKLRSQVDFLVRERADSLAVGGSTGEGHTLSPDELRASVEAVREAMPSDMPLIASAIVDSTHQAIRSIRAVEGLGVDAIQITPVHYLFRPDDEMMIEHFRVIHEETGMPLIIYNVVPWSYLSPELTVRVMEEVPGVMGIKQSAGDLKLFADLVMNAPKDRKIYSAVDALMYPSFCIGTPGVIAATPSAIPRATAVLRDSVAKGDHDTARQLHEAILRFWNAMDHYNLPACIRYAQSLQGVDAGVPRMPMRPATREQQAKMKPALEAVLALAESKS